MPDIHIYQDKPDMYRYRPNGHGGELHNLRPTKYIVLIGGVLHVLDHKTGADVRIPVSRWELSCIIAAIKGNWGK
jgi:hypothetical protein